MRRNREYQPQRKGRSAERSKKKLSGLRSLLITWADPASESAKQ